jgi:hypothetical protein
MASVPQSAANSTAARPAAILRALKIQGIPMGQAKNRGSQAERIAQAQAKIAASKPEKLVCNGCGADVTQIHPVDTRGLRGIEAIWVGQCECGQTTFAASGEPKAVDAFFFALSENSELTLGSQSKDGEQHTTA